MKNISELHMFTHGQIQDALNILKVMERESLTIDDLKEYVQDRIFHPPKLRKDFMKRYSKTQREAMRTQRLLEGRPCRGCK